MTLKQPVKENKTKPIGQRLCTLELLFIMLRETFAEEKVDGHKRKSSCE